MIEQLISYQRRFMALMEAAIERGASSSHPVAPEEKEAFMQLLNMVGFIALNEQLTDIFLLSEETK